MKPPNCEIEARQVTVTMAPSPVKPQVMLTTTITAVAATAVTTATNATVEQYNTNPQDHEELEKVRREDGEERQDKRQQTIEVNEGRTEREETRDDEGMGQKRRDERAPALPWRNPFGSLTQPSPVGRVLPCVRQDRSVPAPGRPCA